MVRLVKSAFLVLLAIRFSLQSFFLRCHFFSLAFFSLSVFSSLISWSACQHFLHIGSRDRQVVFIGNGFLVMASCSQSCHNIGRYFGGVVLPARFSTSAPISFFSSGSFFCQSCGLTKRAPDTGESAQIPGSFLRLSIFSSDGFAVPAPAQVTQTVRRLHN